MFDEYFNPPTIAISLVPVDAAPRTVDLADSPVSTLIDQDTPSTSIPSTQEQEHSLTIYQGFEESPKMPHFHDDPLHKSLHKDLTSQGSSSNDNPSHVYKLKKALYGLKQAPRAWYDMLSSFLISQHFSKGAVDPTLFTQKGGNNLLLGKPVDATLYRGMIGSLMYLTSSRPGLIYDVCLYASIPKGNHYHGSLVLEGYRWSSKKQKSTTISSKEAEYITLSGCCAQILWMRS
ncbi:retrovirus-related pol polyprotein from transposon TNT 1-94 [Tanacetum coccineum]